MRLPPRKSEARPRLPSRTSSWMERGWTTGAVLREAPCARLCSWDGPSLSRSPRSPEPLDAFWGWLMVRGGCEVPSLKWVCSNVPTYSHTLERAKDKQLLGAAAHPAVTRPPHSETQRKFNQLCSPPHLLPTPSQPFLPSLPFPQHRPMNLYPRTHTYNFFLKLDHTGFKWVRGSSDSLSHHPVLKERQSSPAHPLYPSQLTGESRLWLLELASPRDPFSLYIVFSWQVFPYYGILQLAHDGQALLPQWGSTQSSPAWSQ